MTPSEEVARRGFRERINVMSVSQVGLFVLASAYTIYLVRPVLLPLIFALLITLVLKPVHRLLGKYLRLPAPLSALLVIVVVTTGTVVAMVSLTTPVIRYTQELRGEVVKERFRSVFQPLTKIQGDIAEVAEEVEKMTEPEKKEEPVSENGVEPEEEKEAETLEEEFTPPPPPAPAPVIEEEPVEAEVKPPPEPSAVKVQIRDNPADKFYAFAQSFSSHIIVTLALVYFFLAFGDTIVRRLAEVDAAADLIDDLTRDISFYLFTITLINAGLGIAIGVAMWLLGMPNPVLWGVMGALLNFIPYIGAVAGTGIVLVVAVITFEQTGEIVPVPLVYFALTAIEGNLVTPWIIGKRFTINPIIVFVWVLCWGAMWGIPGMLIGLPLLMVFRIVCAKLPGLSRVERVISI